MAVTRHLVNPRSNVRGKAPRANEIEYGEIAVNYNEKEPFIAIKDSSNNVIRVSENVVPGMMTESGFTTATWDSENSGWTVADNDHYVNGKAGKLYLDNRNGVLYFWDNENSEFVARDDEKQDKLISGTNIKTVNGNSIVGSGNTEINEVEIVHERNGVLYPTIYDGSIWSDSTDPAVGVEGTLYIERGTYNLYGYFGGSFRRITQEYQPVGDYVTTGAMNTALGDYVQTASVNTINGKSILTSGNTEIKANVEIVSERNGTLYKTSYDETNNIWIESTDQVVGVEGNLYADRSSLNIYCYMGGRFMTMSQQSQQSDVKLKENIEPISDEDLKKAADLRFVSYKFKSDENSRKRYGVIAQEVQEAGLNELVTNYNDDSLGVDYFSMLCLKVKQLEKEIDELKSKLSK